MTKSIIATFEDVHTANRAIERLYEDGFAQEHISMMVSDTTREKHLAIETHTKAPEGAAAGGVLGGTIGAIAAGLTAVAGLVIPGVGLAIAGPLVAALAGLGAGGAVGGLVGGLVGMGFTETEAKLVGEAVEKGNIAVAVSDESNERIKVAHGVFESTSALDIATM